MSTTFTCSRVRRLITPDMFADLGFPTFSFSPVDGTFHTIQFVLSEDLNAAQIQRARIRLQTASTEHEDLLVSAVGALVLIDTYNLLPAPTQAQAIAHVKVLSQDMRAIITWISKEITS